MTDLVVHYRREFTCNVAHLVASGDPRNKNTQDHGHLMRIIVDSGSDEHWTAIGRWLDRYVDMCDLGKAFDFVTVPVAIASYLHPVFSQIDHRIIAVDVDMDSCGRAVASLAPAASNVDVD